MPEQPPPPPSSPEPESLPGEPPWVHGWPEIRDPRVRTAFARVPRARFVPTALRERAHADEPLPIGQGQTISQPFVIALMVQALALEPGMRVLEIGTGSGYQTAILCDLVQRPGRPPGETVYSLERLPALAEQAMHALAAVGMTPHLAVGDGAAGWPEAAPFDAIVVSAAAAYVPRPLAEQLVEGGRLVIPVGAPDAEQALWQIVPARGRNHFTYLGPVRLVPLLSPLLDKPANRLPVP